MLNKKIYKSLVVAVGLSISLGFGAHAQNQSGTSSPNIVGNIGLGNGAGSVSSGINQNTRIGSVNLDTESVNNHVLEYNYKGECDSSCDVAPTMAPPAAPSTTTIGSYTQDRTVTCGTGYSGNKTQTRTVTNAIPGPWVDVDTSACVCTPTFEDSSNACPIGQSGTYTQRRDWSCNANVGSWGAWATTVSNCFTPCALEPTQSQTLSCPSGFSGSITQERVSSCPGGVGSNSVMSWGAWADVNNTCTPSGQTCVVTTTATGLQNLSIANAAENYNINYYMWGGGGGARGSGYGVYASNAEGAGGGGSSAILKNSTPIAIANGGDGALTSSKHNPAGLYYLAGSTPFLAHGGDGSYVTGSFTIAQGESATLDLVAGGGGGAGRRIGSNGGAGGGSGFYGGGGGTGSVIGCCPVHFAESGDSGTGGGATGGLSGVGGFEGGLRDGGYLLGGGPLGGNAQNGGSSFGGGGFGAGGGSDTALISLSWHPGPAGSSGQNSIPGADGLHPSVYYPSTAGFVVSFLQSQGSQSYTVDTDGALTSGSPGAGGLSYIFNVPEEVGYSEIIATGGNGGLVILTYTTTLGACPF